MKGKDTRIRHGGLFRCCIQDLVQQIEDEREYEESHKIIVACCGDTIELKNGVWVKIGGCYGSI